MSACCPLRLARTASKTVGGASHWHFTSFFSKFAHFCWANCEWAKENVVHFSCSVTSTTTAASHLLCIHRSQFVCSVSAGMAWLCSDAAQNQHALTPLCVTGSSPAGQHQPHSCCEENTILIFLYDMDPLRNSFERCCWWIWWGWQTTGQVA